MTLPGGSQPGCGRKASSSTAHRTARTATRWEHTISSMRPSSILVYPTCKGLAVLRKWRAAKRDMPVLILTAHGTWTEKVEGLNAGADDYITKPFHIPEVVARLRALIRRKSGAANPVLTHKDITLDTVAGKATVGGKAVELTASELRMLTYFMHRAGRVISQNELMEHLYALEESAESNTIEVYISRLRRKLGRDIITTVRGLGYRMD